MIYKKASGGTLTFDGASIPEGRLLSGAMRLYVTDHLGSVKAVVNGNNGNLYEVNNYTVYGKRSANSSASSYISTAPTGEKFRQHFTGKEDQDPDFSVPFTDFGARQYSPALRRWLVPDPLSEKYYGISPYAYCAGDPVNLVDLDGKDFRKQRHAKTITISAHYYVKTRREYDAARQGVSFWNQRKRDTYSDPETGKTYSIRYALSVEMITPQSIKSNHENTIEISDTMVDKLSNNESAGVTKEGKHIYVKSAYAQNRSDGQKSSTLAHEIGHTLGMSHQDNSIMSERQDDKRKDIVTPENINQMMSSERGKEIQKDFLTRLYEAFKDLF